MTRLAVRVGSKAVKAALKSAAKPKPRPRSKPKPVRGPVARKGTVASPRAMGVGVVGSRHYRLYKPPGSQTGSARPLLVMLHGCAQDGQAIASVSQMNRIAAREGFFVLYPEQDRLANVQGCWNWFATRTGRAQREADAVMAMVDQVCKAQRVDIEKVAIAGLSAGASLAGLLASRHPARFCAVAMHSGIAPGAAQSQATALRAMRGRGPAPVALPVLANGLRLPALLVIQGSADHVVAPSNGLDAALLWAACEGAKPGAARSVQRGHRYAATVTDYKVAARLVATHCLINGLGHAWSGGAKGRAYSDEGGPDASRMVWAFAAKQFTAVAKLLFIK